MTGSTLDLALQAIADMNAAASNIGLDPHARVARVKQIAQRFEREAGRELPQSSQFGLYGGA